ncbi:DNA glycosylase AlkZ-like family protein [Mumia zhuanghuii]|uniref:Winged helix DNA-binding domain-containing protein n=1 Tax=Mumia zhuanghuii TaxID=2585211 RepID=A0A5C4M902_9ACTN|nr:crosslink repair DNA glycosylase YcaQ family protein [Mumia zhuanghuii]TNC29994.1 winged helix DNA-binding domain-containing protein [Mumia zhuanghuii]TNC30712.1 winged helix DNA-binding domain-containing protein [Mumia zhuanghuii]
MTARLAPEDLALRTLERQFPTPTGTGVADLVALYDALGPVQTQVPRAAFIFASSRLPGITHETVVEAFDTYALVKGTTLRGTVHSSTPQHHAWASAVTAVWLDKALGKGLDLDQVAPEDVRAQARAYATDEWRDRDELVQHVAEWVAAHESEGHGTVADPHARNLLRGSPWLVRRPPDRRWHTRTDTLYRSSAALTGIDSADLTLDVARRELVRVHLRAFGPATRRDIAWWLADKLRPVDAALAELGDEVVRYDGPEGRTYLDLADAPDGSGYTGGLRLLPEFDQVMLGYEGTGAERGRFTALDNQRRIFNRVNGTTTPVVLDGTRLVAQWRIVPRGTRIDVEIDPLPGERAPSEDAVAEALPAVEAVLATKVADVRTVTG